MTPDNAGKPKPEDQKTKKADSFKDLDDAKVNAKDAEQVKGGAKFNPQPDPPAGR